jgi:hypothetical protein
MTGVRIDDGSAQRSVGRSLSLTFDQDVSASLNPNDLMVILKTNGVSVANGVSSCSATMRSATFAFQNLTTLRMKLYIVLLSLLTSLLAVFPLLASAQHLNVILSVSVYGHAPQGNPDGSFQIPSVTLLDEFGESLQPRFGGLSDDFQSIVESRSDNLIG